MSLCLCLSHSLCPLKPSFRPDSQIMWSRVTAVLHEPPPPPFLSTFPFLPVSALFAERTDNWEGQQATVWVGQIYHHGMPLRLPPHCSRQCKGAESPFFSDFHCRCCQTLTLGLAVWVSSHRQKIKMPDFPGYHRALRRENASTLLKAKTCEETEVKIAALTWF